LPRPRLYTCDHHEIPLPPGHKFPIEKYRLARELLVGEDLYECVAAPPADAGTIALAHDPEYVRRFLTGTLDPAAVRRIGFPWSDGLVRRTLASVGGTLGAARDAVQSGGGFGANLAGGTHHAFRGEGAGFCVFNDIAIAILWLRREGYRRRPAVIDLDVHQGDGTAQIFEEDDAVLTLSLHGRHNFPFRKQRSRIDVALADGTGDGEYLAELGAVLPRVFDWGPDMVFYQAGVDGLAEDRLGRLALTHDGLMERDRMVFEAVRRAGVPLVLTLGGGYAEPIAATVRAHYNTYRLAAFYQSGTTTMPESVT
jgi:acetoin utilization deacetylase AcuC-like enzyme